MWMSDLKCLGARGIYQGIKKTRLLIILLKKAESVLYKVFAMHRGAEGTKIRISALLQAVLKGKHDQMLGLTTVEEVT